MSNVDKIIEELNKKPKLVKSVLSDSKYFKNKDMRLKLPSGREGFNYHNEDYTFAIGIHTAFYDKNGEYSDEYQEGYNKSVHITIFQNDPTVVGNISLPWDTNGEREGLKVINNICNKYLKYGYITENDLKRYNFNIM